MTDESKKEKDIVVEMTRCDHSFHKKCIDTWFKKMECPLCNTSCKIIKPMMPSGGTMFEAYDERSLAGYEDCGTIVIYFIWPDSIVQDDRHPNPGKNINQLFEWQVFLPSNEKGKQVASLFKLGWEKKLLFRVQDYVGRYDAYDVLWPDDITIKTSPNHPVFGYPDPEYLDTVIDEFKDKDISLT